MHLVQILLPRCDNTGSPFPRAEFEQLKNALADRFDGVTAYLQSPAEGLWQEGGQSNSDEILIFEVMTEDFDVEDWRIRRAELERRFRQERVIIRSMHIAVV